MGDGGLDMQLVALSSIIHNGRMISPTEIFDIDDPERAARLCAKGIAETLESHSGAPAGETAHDDAEDASRELAIVRAIETMRDDFKGSEWNSTDGKPKTTAIERLTLFDVTAAERDRVWADMEA